MTTAKQLRDSIKEFNKDQTSLSDPKQLHHVPFPFPFGTKPKDRFLLDKNGNFEFMGRVVLPQLMNTIEKAIESKETLPINVYGTRGYGKSHIIAAVVVLLMKKKGGLPVLFLPQVRDMADSDPLPYLRAAALLTFASAAASDAQIMSDIEDSDSLSALTLVISKHQFILVADQLNSLEEDSRIADDKKKLVRNLLDTLGVCPRFLCQ